MPKFRLQTALTVRERIEKLKQKALAEQLQVVQGIRSQMDSLNTAIANSNSTVNQAKSHGFTIAQLQMHERYNQRTKKEIQVLVQRLKEQESVTNRRQKELTQATQKRRVLEILKEKDAQRLKEEIDRQERAQMDEVSLNQYLRHQEQ